MRTRIAIATLAATSALALPLFAQAGARFVDTDREAGAVLVVERDAAPAPIAAPAVPQDFKRQGGMFVENRGNGGWRYEGHMYALRDGKLVCVDGIDHAARADSAPADRSLYSGG